MGLLRSLVVGCVMRQMRFWGPKGPTVIRLLLAGVGASVLAGCADSSRFGDAGDPLGNPFKTSSRVDRTPTASYNPPPMRAPASAPIQSRSLAAPQQQADYSNYAVPAHPSPKLASAQPLSPHTDITSSTNHPAQAIAGWSANGGTPVIVANGESVDTISSRYGVPRDALIKTNGFGSASEIRPGTRLIVPVYNASLAASSGASPAAIGRQEARREEPPRGTEKMKFVRGAEPASMAKPQMAQAEMKRPEPAKTLREQKLAAKAEKEQARKEQMAARQAPAAMQKQAMQTKPMQTKPMQAAPVQQAIAKREVTKVEPTKTAKVEQAPLKPVDQTPTASLPPQAAAPQQTASNDSANPEFRWPAHGRVIQGFKAGGNDGINISVPEGTAVKAAEGGVVAYAGSELKGYGNLVLIRHPNGFVSAYANNGDIEVKRGETVKRGQVIAKSGQSGNVSSPQLHFELRKGSTPVDPSQYLAGL